MACRDVMAILFFNAGAPDSKILSNFTPEDRTFMP